MKPDPGDEQIQYLSARFTVRYLHPFNVACLSGLWRNLAEVIGDRSGDATPAPDRRQVGRSASSYAATGISLYTLANWLAVVISARRKASRTRSSFLASCNDRYGDQASSV
jgi:hypothetical protein